MAHEWPNCSEHLGQALCLGQATKTGLSGGTLDMTSWERAGLCLQPAQEGPAQGRGRRVLPQAA